ncbi:hypothetical protein BGZ58_007281 [Dissophora ornata]|nr:hypothetical protein BGZ58_007281 [Dissophora ornata]
MPNSISQSDALLLQTPVPIPQYTHPTTATAHKNSNFSKMETPEDDEDEDLYDPEFGIGGSGRRRSATAWNVISVAAAAVSAGWSSSEALAAATADPSGSFLSGSATSVREVAFNNATTSAEGSRSQISLSGSIFLSRGHS